MKKAMILCLLCAVPASAQWTMIDLLHAAFEKSPEYREARRELSEAEDRYGIVLGEQGFQVFYRGEAHRDFDEDRNINLNLDLPGFGTEATRFDRTSNRITLERAVALTGSTLEFGSGVTTTDFESLSSSRNTTRSLFTVLLRQPLLRANPHQLERRHAEQTLLGARADFAARRATIVSDVADRFITCLTAMEERKIRRDAFDEARQMEEMTRAQAVAGDRTELELRQTELFTKEANLAIIENEAVVRKASQELLELAGIVLFEQTRLDESSLATLGGFGKAVEPMEMPALPASFEDHPRIIRARRSLEERRLGVIEVGDRHGAKIDLIGRYQWEGDRNVDLFSDFLKSWEAGVTVTIPLFTSGVKSRTRRIARENLVSAEEELQIERNRVRRDAEDALTQLKVAEERLSIERTKVDQAVDQVRVDEALYQVGEARLDDYLRSQNAVTEARINVLRRQGALVRRRIDYLTSIGADPYVFLVSQ